MSIRKSRLPQGYKEVEYIESTGTQYIDSGVIPTENLEINCCFQSTIEQTRNYIVGVYGISGSNRVQFSYSNPMFAGWVSSYDNTSSLVLDNNKHNIKINKNNFILDNTTIFIPTNASSFNQNAKSIYLFVLNADDSPDSFSNGLRIYSMTMLDGTTLIRNFIPCYRTSDNEIGLYELVNGVFYTNQGTGTFAKGNDVLPKISKIYKGSTQIIRKYKGTQKIYTILPSAFQEVEYIESDGTQYIDTTFVAPNTLLNKKVEIKFSFVSSLVGSGYESAYGLDSNLQLGRQPNALFTDGSASANFGLILGTTYIYKGDYNTGKSYIDNTEVSQRNQNSTGNVYLFASKSASDSTARYLSASRIYYCKMYDNDLLVRNFIPCYRKADNVIGLYDLVNGVFYTNAGTGTFAKGGNV